MTTPGIPPKPEQAPTQQFTLDLHISGEGTSNAEEFRHKLNAKIGLIAMECAVEEGFVITRLELTTGGIQPQGTPAEAVDSGTTTSSVEDEAPKEAEPSLFSPENQEGFNKPIGETFMSDAEVADLNGEEPATTETPEDAKTDSDEAAGKLAVLHNVYTAGHDALADRFGGDELAPLSAERRKEFTDALKAQGMTTVRHAIILGLDNVRDAVEHLRPSLRGRKRFTAEVATLTQGIVDTVSEEAYDVLSKRYGDMELAEGARPVDEPLTLTEIAKFCNDPAQVPARALETAAQKGFGHLPEAWSTLNVADLLVINPDRLIADAASDSTEEHARRCLLQASAFAKQLTAAKKG